MIKTLQVTSIVVALLAVGLIALSVVHGIELDAGVEKILASTGVLEQFKSQQGKSASRSQIPAKSSLVAEAERYARIVNPRPAAPPAGVNPQSRTRPPSGPKVRPVQSNAKFTLEATCYNAGDPDASLAFVDEPGKGQHWVRQGDRLGHLTVEEILDGLVKLRDGQRIEELRVQREPKISLYAGSGGKRKPKTRPSGITPSADTVGPRQNAISVTSTASTPTVTRRPGESEAVYQLRLRAAARKRSLSRTPGTRPVRRPLENNEDIQKLELITTALKNFKQPADVSLSPEAQEAQRQFREQQLDRLMKLRKNYLANPERAKGTETDSQRQ